MNTEPRSTQFEEVRVVLTLSVPVRIEGSDPKSAPYYEASAMRVGDQVRHAIEAYRAPVALEVRKIEVTEEALLYNPDDPTVSCDAFFAWSPAIKGGSPRLNAKPFRIDTCLDCGSSLIEIEGWVDANLNTLSDSEGPGGVYCNACGEHNDRSGLTDELDSFDISRVFEYRSEPLDDDDPDQGTFCEQVGDYDPVTPDVVRVLWTVYGHQVAGGSVALADFDTEDAAVLYWKRLEAHYITEAKS